MSVIEIRGDDILFFSSILYCNETFFPPFSSPPLQDVSTSKYFDEQMLLEIARQEALMEAEEEY